MGQHSWSAVTAPDWSSFQRAFTRDDRDRRILIFRGLFGAHYPDPHLADNIAAAKWLYEHGHIEGAIVYVVWLDSATPAQQFAAFKQLLGAEPPEWLMGVEIDLETWRGQDYEQHGDHSTEINRLYGLFAHYFRSWTAAGLYGNQGDLAELAPHRDPRAWVNIACYGTRLIIRSIKGAIAQQYTDGETKWGVPRVARKPLPLRSFGVASDHNVFAPAQFKSAKAVRNFMRPTARPKPKPKPPAPKPPHPAVKVFATSPDGKDTFATTNDGRIQITSGSTTRYL
jgi:hypothetical protein